MVREMSIFKAFKFPLMGLGLIGFLGVNGYGALYRAEQEATAYQSSLQTLEVVVEAVRPFQVSQYHSGSLFTQGDTEVTSLSLIKGQSQGQDYTLLLSGETPIREGDVVRFKFTPSPRDHFGVEAQAAQRVKVDGVVDSYDITSKL